MLLEKLITPKPKTTLYFVVFSLIFLTIPIIKNHSFDFFNSNQYGLLLFLSSTFFILLHAFGLNNLIYKNDVIKNLGPPPLKEFNNSDIWIYFEVRDTRNIYGTKKIVANNTLILQFDNKGILAKKIFLNKDQMQNIQFEDNETISRGIDNSLLKNILSSTRKRMENLANKNK